MPVDKLKSMSDLDKEGEVRIGKWSKDKAKHGPASVMGWLGGKIKGEGRKKV